MNDEIWKDIPNYIGIYQASNLGRIKRLKSYAKGRWVLVVGIGALLLI